MKTKWYSIVNKDRFQLVLSACLSAALLLSLLFLGTQTVAWFKNYTEIFEDAEVSNIAVSVEYRFGSSGAWKSLAVDSDNGMAIDVTPDDVNNLQLRISYTAKSSAYIRTMVSGSFMNEKTQTVLPQPEDFWQLIPIKDLSGSSSDVSKWVKHGEYLYYADLLPKPINSDTSENETKIHEDILTVNAGIAALDKSSYQNYTGKVYVVVDAVQPDRYDEIWGITTIPTAATTATETATTVAN